MGLKQKSFLILLTVLAVFAIIPQGYTQGGTTDLLISQVSSDIVPPQLVEEAKEVDAKDLEPLIGAAKPWQLNFLTPASPVKAQMNDFHDLLLVIITVITIFVLGLLIYVVVKFRKSKNPIPSKTTHNVKLEVIWTLVPVLILIAIAIPSMRLLYYQDKVADADMTIVATGYQWYWGYEYPDHEDLSFLSYMIPDEEIKEGQKRLLETDNRVVLPIGTDIRLLVTAADVLHAFAMPSLGVKIDAVPGRLNETWVRIDRPGVYYGQCSELCGINHGFMPITIEAVSKEDFEKWLITAKEKFASNTILSDQAQFAALTRSK